MVVRRSCGSTDSSPPGVDSSISAVSRRRSVPPPRVVRFCGRRVYGEGTTDFGRQFPPKTPRTFALYARVCVCRRSFISLARCPAACRPARCSRTFACASAARVMCHRRAANPSDAGSCLQTLAPSPTPHHRRCRRGRALTEACARPYRVRCHRKDTITAIDHRPSVAAPATWPAAAQETVQAVEQVEEDP